MTDRENKYERMSNRSKLTETNLLGFKKGKSSARGSRHCGVWGRVDVRNLTSASKDVVSTTHTRDLQVTMEQLYRCARLAPQTSLLGFTLRILLEPKTMFMTYFNLHRQCKYNTVNGPRHVSTHPKINPAEFLVERLRSWKS